MQRSPDPYNFIIAGGGFWGPKWQEHLQEHPRAFVAAAVEKNQLTAEWPRQTYNYSLFSRIIDSCRKSVGGRSVSGH
jgi:hypothetical protein